MLLIAHPAIGAVLLAEAILGDMAAVLEQLGLLGLHGGKVLRMDAGAPEVGILQVLVRAIAQNALDVLADKGWSEVAGRGEAVDHGRGAFEQERDACFQGILGLLRRLALGDVAPRANDLERLSLPVADQMLLVAEPAVGSVDIAEAIFGRMAILLEYFDLIGFHLRKIVRMDARAPEVGVLEIFVRAVAEQALDVLADEGRRIVAACLEAVDNRRRAFEKQCEAGLQGIFGLLCLLPPGDVAPRADDLERGSLFVADHLLLVADPAVG